MSIKKKDSIPDFACAYHMLLLSGYLWLEERTSYPVLGHMEKTGQMECKSGSSPPRTDHIFHITLYI